MAALPLLVPSQDLDARRFGAVYRGTWRAQDVAVKKLFVESSGHASPEQITELENEGPRRRRIGLQTQSTYTRTRFE